MTIRTRLALTYGAAVALTIVALGGMVWWQFGIGLRSSLEGRLETRLAAVSSSLENAGQAGLQENDEDGELFVVLLSADGSLLETSRNAPAGLVLSPGSESTRELSSGGRRFLVRSEQAEGGVSIVVGADLEPVERSQASLAGLLVGVGVLVAVCSLGGGWWLAGRALRPVAEITAEAAAIDASDLDRRLPEPRRADELGVLARTLNGMLDRIADALRRQRAFVAAASHDLRTPLAALQTELELADRPEAGHEELRSALRAARDDAARLAELSGDLLQLASVAPEGSPLVLVDVDLSELVAAVMRRVAPVAERAEVRLHSAVRPRLVSVDRIRIEQALANLVVNAVTYSSPGGEVEIAAVANSGHPRGAEVDIEVRDRGPGVPAAERDVIFEPFRRGGDARGPGAGLGLATVRAAVTAHGGSVTVHDRDGGGAVFRIRLPVERGALRPPAPPDGRESVSS